MVKTHNMLIRSPRQRNAIDVHHVDKLEPALALRMLHV